MDNERLEICLINVMNTDRNTATNKDLNGGFGTCDNYGNSIPSKIIKFIKWKSIHLPIISFAFLESVNLINDEVYSY
ncbi:hypothetical protein HY500_00570 [Candidatus Woesearchaeota archaeon]|nr:hypothetical protein [Candidatus Woesearchaeota archaeon]